MTFSSLGLSAPLLRSTEELGYGEPTPAQRETIAPALEGRDAWVSAETGSGKTAAFVLPILERWSQTRPSEPRVTFGLVLVPTRELAHQVAQVIEALAWHLDPPPRTCVLVGGESIDAQQKELRGGADLIVATPGRLLDFLSSGAVSVSSISTLVLDEADRLLGAGFAEERDALFMFLPAKRQNLLFSATFPPAIRTIANTFLVDPVPINIDSGGLPSSAKLTQRAIEVDAVRRTELLQHLLKTQPWSQVLVFVANRATADELARALNAEGAQAAPLHGGRNMRSRTEALAAFKRATVRVLVATDLAARGVDIAGLPAVVNYDLPRGSADYLHRVGRTGRAGDAGVAISFITAEGAAHFSVISRRHGLLIERERVAGFEPMDAPISPRDPRGGVKGKRKSKKDKLREAATAKEAAKEAAPDAKVDSAE